MFDEIEKAHPDVMNILLQILDEGHINDAQGRNVSFENTVIIMTSNAGSTDKSFGIGFEKTAAQVSRDRAIKGLREFLRPEFISRVDEIVVFNPLTKDNYADIAHIMLGEMVAPLSEKLIMFTFDRAAELAIADMAYDEKYGARDIRRVLQKEVEDKIATMIVDSGIIKLRTINVTAEDGKIKVEGLKRPLKLAANCKLSVNFLSRGCNFTPNVLYCLSRLSTAQEGVLCPAAYQRVL